MNAEFLSVISVAGRLLLYSSVCTIMWAYMTAELLNKKRKLTVLITWMLFRHVLITSFANVVLRYYFQDRLWWDFFFFLLMFLIIIGNCVTEYYTFEGTLSKVLAGGFLAEIVLIPSCYFSLGIVNMLEGQEFDAFEVELQALDILIPILFIVFFLLTRYFFKNILHRFRDYNLHFSNLVWILVMMNLVSYFPKYAEESGFIMICLGNGLIIGMLIMFVLLKHALSLKQETEFLIEQQRMMEYHYLALQGQMTQIQEYQEMVDEQMVAVENRTVTRKNLSEYIENLKQEYHQIWAGIYCNDRMIDAVLYSQSESLKKKGIDLKCNLAGYDRGTIEEKDLAQILMKMLAWGTKEAEKMSKNGGTGADTGAKNQIKTDIQLQMRTIKNKLLIECSVPAVRKNSPPQYALRRMSRQYDGAVTYEYEEGKSRLMSALTR